MKVIRVRLIKKIDNFCMSVDDVIEFYRDGFRTVGVNDNYYPKFGPYYQLNEVGNLLLSGDANAQTKEMFEAEDVTNIINPTTEFEIGLADGTTPLCRLGFDDIMELLSGRDSKLHTCKNAGRKFEFILEDDKFKDDVLKLEI